ncbi:MAG: lipid A export permease/ATP-binding protein MsbA [Proteobacteria bacterium]|nr:lipid A export permease/ATP-binding protein MsbA [Pseudomonadota bacterium]
MSFSPSFHTLNTLKLSDKTVFFRILKEYVWPYRSQVVLAFLCMLMFSGALTLLAKLMEPIINDIFIQKDETKLIGISILIFGAFLVKGLGLYGENYYMNYVSLHLVMNLQKKIFDTLLKTDLVFFQNHPTGDLISRAINDVSMMRNSFTFALSGAGKHVVSVVCLVVLMFYQDWVLACISFFAFPSAFYPIIRLGKRLRKATTNAQQDISALTSLLSQVFQGIRLVKAYGMEVYEKKRLGRISETIFKHVFKSAQSRALSSPIMETLGGVAIIVVIFYGGSQVISGGRSPGAFFSFITALLLAYEPLKKLSQVNSNIQEGLAAATRVFALLEMKPFILDKKEAQVLDKIKGSLAFENVSFSYAHRDGTKQPIKALSNIDFTVSPGETIAFVGPSGSGKSTLLNLIPRFYDVDKGRILIDGNDVKDVTLSSLRKNIALVTQEVTLFDDTVFANIAYGKENASFEEVVEAAKSAAAHEFIMELPEGYQTFIGEQGIKLSGGQRQRLSIARALLRNAPLLLLDEATSALDNQSERQVQNALNNLMKNRTCLVVAHRLSTIQDADLIYVLHQGKIIEKGTHTELLAAKGLYAELYHMQYLEEEILKNKK